MENRSGLPVTQNIMTHLLGLVALFISTSGTAEEVSLTGRRAAIVPIAAHTASGDLQQLTGALNNGLDNGICRLCPSH